MFVFPTLYETQGRPVLEAMAFGLPAIVSKIGPIEDIVKLEEGSAILVNPNDPNEIADAILQVLRNQALSRQMSIKGRKLAGNFDWKTIAEKLGRIYETVLTEYLKGR
ncbi:glycosyltransferase [Dehalococcoidia bacterium]|nr:glycosyltransferase [Dehalococcoidia bacterium]